MYPKNTSMIKKKGLKNASINLFFSWDVHVGYKRHLKIFFNYLKLLLAFNKNTSFDIAINCLVFTYCAPTRQVINNKVNHRHWWLFTAYWLFSLKNTPICLSENNQWNMPISKEKCQSSSLKYANVWTLFFALSANRLEFNSKNNHQIYLVIVF